MIDTDEWGYSTTRERARLLWREFWGPVRWGVWFLSYAAVLRIGFELGRAA